MLKKLNYEVDVEKKFRVFSKEKGYYNRYEYTSYSDAIKNLKTYAFIDHDSNWIEYWIEDIYGNETELIPAYKYYKNENWKYKFKCTLDWYDIIEEELEFDTLEDLIEELMADLELDNFYQEYYIIKTKEEIIKETEEYKEDFSNTALEYKDIMINDIIIKILPNFVKWVNTRFYYNPAKVLCRDLFIKEDKILSTFEVENITYEEFIDILIDIIKQDLKS